MLPLLYISGDDIKCRVQWYIWVQQSQTRKSVPQRCVEGCSWRKTEYFEFMTTGHCGQNPRKKPIQALIWLASVNLVSRVRKRKEDDRCGSVQLFGLHTRVHGGARQSCHNLHYLLYTDQTQTQWMINFMPCFTDQPVRTKVSRNPNIAYIIF